MKHLIRISWILSLAALGVCTICALLFHSSVDFTTYLEWDVQYVQNGVPQFIGMLLLIAVLMLMLHFMKSISKKAAIIVTLSGMVWVAVVSGVWVYNNTYLPLWDQNQVWDAIQNVAHGTYGWMDSGYFRTYPFNMSIVTFFGLSLRILGVCSVTIFRICNIVAAAILEGGIATLSYKLFEKYHIMAITAILGACFFPVCMYTTFVYGTLMSLALIAWAFILLIDYFQKERFWKLIVLAILMAFANALYSGTIIATIAIEITLGINALMCVKKRKATCAFASVGGILLIVLLATALQSGTKNFFTAKTGAEHNQASPATAIILMGITSDGENTMCGPGSYDASTISLYVEAGRDHDAANKLAVERLKVAVGEYLSGKRDWTFFLRKIRNEWSDPWFSAAVMTVYPWNNDQVPEEFSAFLESDFMSNMQMFLTAYMMVMYVLAFITIYQYVFGSKKEEGRLCDLLIPMYFCGGFFFYIVWESKPRYSMSYFIFLIPFAAYGVNCLERLVVEKVRRS